MEAVYVRETWIPRTEPKIGLTILDGKFFKYIEDKSTPYRSVGMCQRCLPKIVEIKESRNCTTSFVRHLRRVHGEDVLEEYQSYLKYRKARKGLPKHIATKRS